MADIGSASLKIVPRFDGLSASVNDALGAVDTTTGGRTMGQGMASGITQSLTGAGAIAGAAGALTSMAVGQIQSHIGDAVARIDTLHNYPLVMQSLGVSSEEAAASVQTMSDRLQNLPTRLDSMTTTVQGLYAATQQYGVSLTTATDAGLALNDLLLAGGGSTQVVNAAMEQFRQMLSKGKPDMQDWRSLLSAAPGQMNQLAQSMLGAEATASDLYYALGGGKDSDAHLEGIEFASISMDQLLDALIALDQQGGDAFASLTEQAETAQGGIGTAMANMGNAVTKGLASLMDEVGRDSIAGVFDDIKGAINGAFGVAREALGYIVPIVKGAYEAVKPFAPQIAGIASAFLVLNGTTGIISNIGGAIGGLSTALLNIATNPAVGAAGTALFGGLASGLEGLGAALMGPVGIGLGIAAVGLGACFVAAQKAQQRFDDVAKATDGMLDVMRDTEPAVSDMKDALEEESVTADEVAGHVNDVLDAHNKLAESIASTNEATQTSMDRLTIAQNTIDRYAGSVGDLSEGQLTLLAQALEEVNDQCGTQYQLTEDNTGIVNAETGEILDNTEAIRDSIAARQEELRLQAVANNYQAAYAQLLEDERVLREARQGYDDAVANGDVYAQQEALEQLNAAEDAYNSAAEAVGYYEDKLQAAQDAEAGVEHQTSIMSANMRLVDEAMGGSAEQTAAFIQALSDAGISQEQFEGLSTRTAQALVDSFDAETGAIGDASAAITEINQNTLRDQNGHITMSTAELEDANGEMYIWNGTTLKTQDGKVVTDYRSLVDANGAVWTWNGTTMSNKSAEAEVTGNAANGWAAQRIRETRDEIARLKSKYVNVGVKVGGHVAENARGGIRTHADGGIRYHAGGSIVNRATPLDIVGEAGSEAIVPLTQPNVTKYGGAFIDAMVAKLGATGIGNITNNNMYLNGRLIKDAEIEALVERVIRRHYMKADQ